MPQLPKTYLYQNKNEKILTYAPSPIEEGKTAILYTATGEPFMPVRLYFKFLKRKSLVNALNRLRCLEWDDDNHFFISYWEETRGFPLSSAYDDVPEDIFPVLLAKGHIRNDDVHIDLRSFLRATEMVRFLYKHIGPKFLYITHMATYNRYFDTSKDTLPNVANLNFDDLFSDDKIQEREPHTQEELEEVMNRPIPVIEKLSVRGTKEGLAAMDMKLMINLMCAQEYADGNTDCTLMEILPKMANLAQDMDSYNHAQES
jgi:hypothetical protein